MPTVHASALVPVRSVYADDPDFRKLLEQFAAAMPERICALRESHRSAGYDLLSSQAHQLKGAGGGFGFPQLTELAADLEQACHSQDPLRIIAALDPLLCYMNRITA
jgi:HPt (histidine-containing phosphotransfer) domain-containing protein